MSKECKIIIKYMRFMLHAASCICRQVQGLTQILSLAELTRSKQGPTNPSALQKINMPNRLCTLLSLCRQPQCSSGDEHVKDAAGVAAELLEGVVGRELRLCRFEALLLVRRYLDADQQLRGTIACARTADSVSEDRCNCHFVSGSLNRMHMTPLLIVRRRLDAPSAASWKEYLRACTKQGLYRVMRHMARTSTKPHPPLLP
jgi:hypothetical protein